MTGTDKKQDALKDLAAAIEDVFCPIKATAGYFDRKPEGNDGGQTTCPPLHGESHWINVAEKDQRAGMPLALKVR